MSSEADLALQRASVVAIAARLERKRLKNVIVRIK